MDWDLEKMAQVAGVIAASMAGSFVAIKQVLKATPQQESQGQQEIISRLISIEQKWFNQETSMRAIAGNQAAALDRIESQLNQRMDLTDDRIVNVERMVRQLQRQLPPTTGNTD
jgi:esterase/lipase